MKKLSIISIGMGGDSLSLAARRAVEEAEALLGAPRMLGQFAHLNKPAFSEYAPEAVARIMESEPYERFALLVSGDAGFYSAADALTSRLSNCEARVIPGISSLSYLFAKLKRPWQEAALVSCHGRESNIVDTVRRNATTFALTGGNLRELAARLVEAGFGELPATLGENLGMADERVCAMPVAALSGARIGSLAVLIIDNPGFDPCVRSGIPDEEFLRGAVPMTKAEVRAVTLSRLSLVPASVSCDIGCGTGSVSIEMAFAAYHGKVYAVDHNAEAIHLTTENAKRFHVGNIQPLLGEATEILAGLPPLDAAFIGGSGGHMKEIFSTILAKNPKARIVVNAVALESVGAALAAFSENGMEPEIVQLCAARAKPAGDLHVMAAQNPVFVISGGGHA